MGVAVSSVGVGVAVSSVGVAVSSVGVAVSSVGGGVAVSSVGVGVAVSSGGVAVSSVGGGVAVSSVGVSSVGASSIGVSSIESLFNADSGGLNSKSSSSSPSAPPDFDGLNILLSESISFKFNLSIKYISVYESTHSIYLSVCSLLNTLDLGKYSIFSNCRIVYSLSPSPPY